MFDFDTSPPMAPVQPKRQRPNWTKDSIRQLKADVDDASQESFKENEHSWRAVRDAIDRRLPADPSQMPF